MHHRTSLLAAALAVLTLSCSSARPPLRTALVDLTGESRTVRVYPSSLSPFPIALHKQAVSIGGLLNIPDVGQEFEFPGHNDVTTAVGIAVVQSYRLIGEADMDASGEMVPKVRRQLEEVQSLALEASLLTTQVAQSRANLAQREDARLAAELARLETHRDKLESDLRIASDLLRDLASTPGIIVARWDSTERGGFSALLERLASFGGESEARRSGFVILGGLRVVSLALGEDFWWLLNNLRPHEKAHIEKIGITTQLIQARDVAYTSDVLVRQGAQLRAQLSRVRGARVDSARIESYWSFVGQYSNAGVLPRVVWKREPFCAVCTMDLPGLAKPEDRALQAHFEVEHKPLDPASYQGWRTVSATITYLRDIPWVFSWKKHSAQFTKSRTMRPAPSCPFCKDRPVAVVRAAHACGASPASEPPRHAPEPATTSASQP